MISRRILPRLIGLGLGLGVAGFRPDVTLAQQAPAPEATPAPSTALAEIVVTAEKRSENLQKVPIVVQAFDHNQIVARQIVDEATLSNSVPGLNVTRASFATDLFLRGVGNFTATPGVEGAVAIYVDDVYHPSAVGSTFSFNNVANIEVDKGPQGTLFGRNAAGGVIQVFTRDPKADPHVDVDVGYGNYNTTTADFYGTTAVAPNLAADLAVQVMNEPDGWGKNYYTGQRDFVSYEDSARTKWLYTPSDATKVTFSADYDRNRYDDPYAVYPGTVNIAGYPHVGGWYDVDENLYGKVNSEQYGASLKVQHDFGWAQASSISSWRDGTTRAISPNDAGPTLINKGPTVAKEEDATQEFQLSAPKGSKIQWIGGIFLFWDKAQRDPHGIFLVPQYCAHPNCQELLYSTQNTVSYAGYGQATAPLTSDTRITLGLRYTADTRKIFGTTYDDNGLVISSPPAQQHTWPQLTYKAAIDHDFTGDIMGYASYSRGFNSGTYSVNNPAAPPVAPQIVDAYETGLKTDLLDHTVRINVTAFYQVFSNLQIQQVINGVATLLNSGEATFPGVDLDIAAAPTEHLRIEGALEAMNPHYSTFTDAAFNIPCTTPQVNKACATSVAGGGYFTQAGDATGNYVQYAQPFTASLSGQYVIPTDSGQVSLNTAVAYSGKFFFDVQNTFEQKPYVMLNSSVTWTSRRGDWDVKLWGENLLGVEYIAQGQVSAVGKTYIAGAPRTFGLKIGYHWN